MTDLPEPIHPSQPPTSEANPPLIVFDGVCVLCSGFVRMVVRLDRKRRFRFATAQSPLGEALFRNYGLRTDSYETNLVLVDGAAFTRLESFVAVMAELGWPWRAARLLLLLPRGLRNWLYDRIAKNRYSLFGRKDSCDIPSATIRERLIG
ncbi:Putative thiol-disulphide oxidoreductase DCC (modular protein) [Mesorhizobium metallidurans STM 2683]|uniref:Putative thiol-disulphide oxidoreductase DCC (Modular protein) n=1 Tax=Mesorhizobium metallidurans STM 2683 TaxID=1297569 RepID=M5EID9_9HYPH|nr:DCC1-like thiol-disulfide oxidoreductase family protein [Mesorhizobium metallidurans]CCV04157.1 Putative thiol-disulphide oxidoreductase DCC (modular protein) [Mesorhizobium metallidurans STM 2683]